MNTFKQRVLNKLAKEKSPDYEEWLDCVEDQDWQFDKTDVEIAVDLTITEVEKEIDDVKKEYKKFIKANNFNDERMFVLGANEVKNRLRGKEE